MLNLSSGTISFEADLGTIPAPRTVTLTTTGGQVTALVASVSFSGAHNDWLSATFDTPQASSAAAATLTLEVTRPDLPVGSHGAVVAISSDNAANSPQVNVTIEIAEGGPARTLLVGGDDQSGPVASDLPEQLQVRVLDADGAPQPGVTVTWAILTGMGSFPSGATSQTDAGGVATAVWRLGNIAGEQTARASAVGSPVDFSAIADPGPPNPATTTLVASPPIFTAGSSSDVTATVRDEFGNLIGGTNLDLSSDVGSSTFGDPTLQTATSGADLGKASTGYSSTVAGEHTITAQIGLFAKTVQLEIRAGAASNISATTATTGSAIFGAGVAVPPAVLVTDQFNNPVPDLPVNWSLIRGKGTVFPSVPTNSIGVSTVSWTLDELSPGYDPDFAVVNEVRAAAAVSTGSPVTFLRTVQVSFANVQTLFGTDASATTPGTCLGAGCHVGPLALDLRPGESYDDLTGVGGGDDYVIESDSITISNTQNRLLFRLQQTDASSMPVPDRGGTLPPNIITIIAAWIAQGAPGP